MVKIFKRESLMLLIAVMVITTLFAGFSRTNVYAEDIPSGYIAIRTKADLDKIRNNPGGNYILMDDIVFEDKDFQTGGDFYNNGKCWLPIGDKWNEEFTGILDGNGHKIKNLQIRSTASDEQWSCGFIGENLGTVKNLKFENFTTNVKGSKGVGIVVTNYGVVKNVSSFGGKITVTDCERGKIGGIVGANNLYNSDLSSVEECYNTSSISVSFKSSHTAASGMVGGIIGDNRGKVSKCYNTGNIKANSDMWVGGIAGYASNFVKGDGDLGGEYGKITDCFNTGTITGGDRPAAGIVGAATSRKDGKASIMYCYNVGTFGGDGTPICSADKGVVKNCYYLNNQHFASGVKGTKKSLSQMKKKSTYNGFNFNSTWKMDTSAKYGLPVLRNVKSSDLTISKKGAAKLIAPILTVKTIEDNGEKWHNISISKVSGATGYQIYYSFSGKKGSWEKIKTIKANEPLEYSCSWYGGKACYYKVRAYRKVGSKYTYSPFSKVKKGAKTK